MIPRPDTLPIWADQDQVDPVSLQNNVLTPPPEYQQFGWTRQQFPPRNWFNWLARYTYRWLAYLGQQEAQAVVGPGTGETYFDVVNGGLCYIYVVDTGNAAAVYNGMVYLPPASSSPSYPISFIDIKKVTITTPQISSAGTVTIAGGTGPYIVYGQTKTIPS
jgi:hypothetical protein